jgi:hypothetical protein
LDERILFDGLLGVPELDMHVRVALVAANGGDVFQIMYRNTDFLGHIGHPRPHKLALFRWLTNFVWTKFA